KFARSSRVLLVRCRRLRFSICDRYDWLIELRDSFLMARTTSCCVISRPRPRSVPSICRKYRSFSPRVILQLVICILRFVIKSNKKIDRQFVGLFLAGNLLLLVPYRGGNKTHGFGDAGGAGVNSLRGLCV